MASDKIVPTREELDAFDLDDPQTVELIQYARDSHDADAQLTLLGAVKKYRKACLWAAVLSTSLVMEGYDLVIVCLSVCTFCLFVSRPFSVYKIPFFPKD